MLEKQKQKHGRCGLNSIVSVQIKIGSGKLTFFERVMPKTCYKVPEANKVETSDRDAGRDRAVLSFFFVLNSDGRGDARVGYSVA